MTKPVYQGDLFIFWFSSYFDLSSVTAVKSVLLGTGTSFEGSGWDINKITSDDMVDSLTYNHQFDVGSNMITIYSFNNNIDARTTNADDKYAVFQIEGVKNPSAKYSKSGLTFTVGTYRYTYDGGPMMAYDQTTLTFADDLVAGTIPTTKCDFSNSGYYSSYISDKKVPSDINMFVDFSFTTENPVVSGGKIVVVLDGMATASGTGFTSWIYVIKGLTPVDGSDYVSAVWDSDDTVKFTGYKSTTSAPTVEFTAQVKISGGDCFKSVTTYTSD